MSDNSTYINNSQHKEMIRGKWVEFIRECVSHDDGIGVITFPAEEMQDLHLFKENGLIDWDETETGAYNITKGKVVCFERSHRIFASLSSKLVNVVLENEIGSYLRQNYNKIATGNNSKVFPVDAINLDYDGRIANSKVPIGEKIELIFKFQGLYKRNFSFFVTWPSTETEDEDQYKKLLKKTIENNLVDPSATSFKEEFEKRFNAVDQLDYDNLSLIGLTKIILKKASNCKFKLSRNEFYVYGEEGKKKMYSVLFNFEYVDDRPENLIYSEDVISSLSEISILSTANTN